MNNIVVLMDEIARLRAENDELRLTLAAEQMWPHGAPSNGWRADGEVWVKDYPDGTQAGVQPDGLWWRGEGHKPARWHGRADSRRAAMRAADKSNPREK